MATVTLTQENFEQTVSSNDIVLVDFWATWCGPCRQFGPVFEAASEKYPDVVFGKIDTDDQQQLAMAALEDLVTQIQNLDMDDVRKKIAEADQAE